MTIISQFAEKDIGLQFLHSISATSTRLQLAKSAFQVIQTSKSNCLLYSDIRIIRLIKLSYLKKEKNIS